MIVENGQWIPQGVRHNDPNRIKTWKQLTEYIKEAGFLPLFSNEVKGFSVEEHVGTDCWWTGDTRHDPWEWREIIASRHEVAYGKFFGGRAGFISTEWFAYFANYRREGYDFDARWEDGLAMRREKIIMDYLTERGDDGDLLYPIKDILTTDLKKETGFGKGGEKNFPGVITSLQMQTYLVTADFRRKVSKKGEEYGMAVSVLVPPEALWGYEMVTSAYSETPYQSWERGANENTNGLARQYIIISSPGKKCIKKYE
jgi:hypothetical protein